MRFTAIFLVFALFVFTAFGQKAGQPKKVATTKPQQQKTVKTAAAKSGKTAAKATSTAKVTKPAPKKPKVIQAAPLTDEKTEFEAAVAAEPLESVNALRKFIADFPKSERIPKARELLTVARAKVADEKIRNGDADGGIALFKLAVEDAPRPMPEKLFGEVVSKFPYSLYFNGQRAAAIDVASAIESHSSSSGPQLLALANFYVATENGSETLRLADAAIKLDPNSSPGYQALGLAHRLNFELEESAKAYAKALELDPDSLNSKQSLAEMYRALGKADEAEKLYREMLAIKADDLPAQTGLALSLFDGGKQTDAEVELTKSLEVTPKNVILLSGAAYWYAANGNAEKAVELAQKAVDYEPRYIWSYIALARGLRAQQKPVDAERILIKARTYGNFPTVEYEIASARLTAGFYREAAEELEKHFVVTDSGVSTKLGGRVERNGKDFEDLIAAERKASIFEAAGGNNSANDAKLKQLLELHQKNEATAAAAAADSFVDGSDPMKVHRQLYAASLLLQKNIALDKVVELARSATDNTDAGLGAADAAAAVMASELYESRSLAFSRNEFLEVPNVPRSTLSAILRGRVEDLAGWALYQKSDYPQAIVRLRRAISVLPDKSAWWRASMWRLGAALAADGKEKEALDSYLQSYKTDKPDLAKFLVVEATYKRVKGTDEGLDTAIGKDRMFVSKETAAAPIVEQKTEAAVEPAVVVPGPKAEEAPKIPKGVPVEHTIDALKIESRTETVVEKPPAVTEATPQPEPIKIEGKPQAEATPAPTTSEIPAQSTPQPEAKKIEEKPKEEAAPVMTITEPPPAQPTPQSEPIMIEEKPQADATPAPSIEQPKTEDKPVEIKGVLSEKKDDTKIMDEPIRDTAEPKAASSEVVKPAAEVSDTTAPPKIEPKADPKNKPLFEPIIITIPSPTRKTETPAEKKADTAESGASRPRIVEGIEVKAEEIPACTINVSAESISLINNGGTIGVLVGIDDEAMLKELTAFSSSPKDIEVKYSPELGDNAKKMYVIRSLTSATGIYQVTFAASCGKKIVTVTIR